MDLPPPLRAQDLPRAAALSALIGWNQLPEDWAHFLHHGALRALDGGFADSLGATAGTIRYGDVAWISMVLVRPELRRQGLATRLMRWAVESLHAAQLPCMALDATPAGREVYGRLGFRDLWGFTRFALPATLPAGITTVRPLRHADWPAVEALDLAGFGAARGFLLRDFAARLPGAGLVAESQGRITGALLGRDGLRGPQLGPLYAEDTATAAALLASALPAAPGAVIDLRDGTDLVAFLTTHGATPQRPFTRMALGDDPPGDHTRILAVAGPEFG